MSVPGRRLSALGIALDALKQAEELLDFLVRECVDVESVTDRARDLHYTESMNIVDALLVAQDEYRDREDDGEFDPWIPTHRSKEDGSEVMLLGPSGDLWMLVNEDGEDFDMDIADLEPLDTPTDS